MAEQARQDLVQAMAAMEAERGLYARILELSRQCRTLASAGQNEELLALIGQKGQLSDQVVAVAERSRELKADWNSLSQKLSVADRERGGSLIVEIRSLLQQILAEDAECQKLLSGRRENALEGLLKMQQGKRMHQAYGRKPVHDPQFKDEKK